MLTLTVENMSCSHCVARVTKAVQTVAPQAQVTIDLQTKKVEVTGAANEAEIIAAINDAGYPAQKAA